MASKLNPYITFGGNAREAMEFYQEVFGGTLAATTFGEFGMTDPADSQKIMHAQLETANGFTLMAADNAPGFDYTPGNNVAISLSGEDEAELRSYWERLLDGGTVVVPLEKQMWGDVFGMCADRFGTQWMVNVSQPQPQPQA
jgi:PhnB protein